MGVGIRLARISDKVRATIYVPRGQRKPKAGALRTFQRRKDGGLFFWYRQRGGVMWKFGISDCHWVWLIGIDLKSIHKIQDDTFGDEAIFLELAYTCKSDVLAADFKIVAEVFAAFAQSETIGSEVDKVFGHPRGQLAGTHFHPVIGAYEDAIFFG